MMNRYKIVFIDIDDTLNPTNKKVSLYTKEVMKKLKEKGIKLVLNTGRSVSYAINKSREAGLSEYVIGSNGSEIYNYETKEKVLAKSISKKDIKKIYEYCKLHDMTMVMNSFEKRYVNTTNYSYNDEAAIYIDDIDKLVGEEDINQIVILSTNYDRMLVIPNLFKEKFPDLNIIHSSINLVEQRRAKGKEYYHDIVLSNTSKGSGIVELLDYFNIDSSEAIAIGNGYDDVSMCDVVGLSVAVGNAVSLLKEVATCVTDSSEEDGVAKILEKLCLEEKEAN